MVFISTTLNGSSKLRSLPFLLITAKVPNDDETAARPPSPGAFVQHQAPSLANARTPRRVVLHTIPLQGAIKKASCWVLAATEENKKDYRRFLSHEDIESWYLAFALRITRSNSFLKCRRHEDWDGWIPLEIWSFHCIQIHQLITILTSMKKGMPSWFLKLIKCVKRIILPSYKSQTIPASLCKWAMNKEVR